MNTQNHVGERLGSSRDSGRIRATPIGGGTPDRGLTSKTPAYTGGQVADRNSIPHQRQSDYPSVGGA